MTTVTFEEARAMLKTAVGDNQAAWARTHGLSPAYVSDVLNGRRDPGNKILEPLGLCRVDFIQPLDNPS